MSVCERSSTNYGQEPNIRCFVASHALIEVAKGDEWWRGGWGNMTMTHDPPQKEIMTSYINSPIKYNQSFLCSPKQTKMQAEPNARLQY